MSKNSERLFEIKDQMEKLFKKASLFGAKDLAFEIEVELLNLERFMREFNV